MQKEKKGFSIELFTKESIEDYTVYFETKGDKLVYCYIQDSFLNKTFRAKAVKHEADLFSKYEGMQLAFDRCLEKRFNCYNNLINKTVKDISIMRDHDIKIEKKFVKFLESTK
jgi:hypothetical protein